MEDHARSASWDTLLKSVETEPLEVASLKGASGLNHPILRAGIDEARRRLVVISGESDARSAALAQADIQAEMRGARVVLARAAPINLGVVAEQFARIVGGNVLTREHVAALAEAQKSGDEVSQKAFNEFAELIKPAIAGYEIATVDWLGFFKEVVHQLSLLAIVYDSDEFTGFDVSGLVALDPVEVDRRVGVCSIPLYDFDREDTELFRGSTDIEAARDVLRRRGILQYFFPPPDHLALGLIEAAPRSHVRDPLRIVGAAPDAGHPLGPNELVPQDVLFSDLLSVMKEQGLVVEAEACQELSEHGRTTRISVKGQPREGIISKLVNRFSVSVDLNLKDLKNIFGPGSG
jgi:hypothetical protein